MRKAAALALLAAGLALLVIGINAADSLASEVSEFLTGRPTQGAIWFVLGGIAAVAFGAGLLLFTPKPAR